MLWLKSKFAKVIKVIDALFMGIILGFMGIILAIYGMYIAYQINKQGENNV